MTMVVAEFIFHTGIVKHKCFVPREQNPFDDSDSGERNERELRG